MPTSLGPGLFVTGTDTGVGKTAVGCALLRLSRRAGHRMIPFKPVETGCAAPATPHDATALWRAAGSPIPLHDVTGATFDLAAAPAVAAAAAGAPIDIDALVAQAHRLRDGGDALLVEGAGGLLVPYRGAITAADLAARLGLPILVVARASLGTINHTALTLGELRQRGLPLAGVVLCETAAGAHDPALDHAGQILAVTGVRPLGLLPHVAAADADHLADALLRAIGAPAVTDLLGISRNRLD